MEGYSLVNSEVFTENNPNTPVYYLYGDASKEKGKRNIDRLVKKWWESEGKELDFEYALFMEWDVLFDEKIENIFSEDSDFEVKTLIQDGSGWIGFRDRRKILSEFKTLVGVGPLCLFRISRKCLEVIFNRKNIDALYAKDMAAGLRFGSLINSFSFQIKELDNIKGVDWGGENKVVKGKGVWHPVKNVDFS